MKKKKVLVIGGGAAGMTSALEMAERGTDVILVEKDSEIGGRGATYCCKATDECNRCAACLVLQQKDQVIQEPNIQVYTDCDIKSIKEIEKKGQRLFRADVVCDGQKTKFETDAVIVATGFDPYDLSRRNEFSYGQESNVVTALELEEAIKDKGSIRAAYGDDIKKIGFIQCVGSRDLSIGNGYCSRVCCMYAGKLAKLIRQDLPDAEIDIFYMDFQSFGKGFSAFKETLEGTDQVKLIRGIPSKIYGFPYDRLTVRYANSYDGKQVEEKYDLIVLSVAITPTKGSQDIAQQLGINLDEYGFMASNGNSVQTGKQGVFVAGVCQGPKDIPQTVGHAKTAAGEAYNFLCG